MSQIHNEIKELQTRIEASIIGQKGVVKSLLIGLLADGNLLLEGLPGLGEFLVGGRVRRLPGVAKDHGPTPHGIGQPGQ